MPITVYDFAIIGAGAAGLHLAQAMLDDAWFLDKTVLIVEKEDKDKDDRTWSFWEKGSGKWDGIVAKTWEKGVFNTNKKSIAFNLAPYQYKMLPSIHFYEFAKARIFESPQFHWVKDEVKGLVSGEVINIEGQNSLYQAKQVFDSRIEEGFKNGKDGYYRILQHFKGWVIETKEAVFDPTTFVMMDYQIKLQDSTSFTYVLPTSPYSALIEFTLFNLELLENDEYDHYLQRYIGEILKIKEYTISKIEYGVIPMSDYPFHKANRPGITKIGTAGSWVKPSSGYAFKNIEKMAGKVVANLKQNRAPDIGLLTTRFRQYDALFLDVFTNYNQLGEEIFTTMYSKNTIQQILSFLDEETNLLEEIKIMNSFDPRPFLKAILYKSTRIRI